MLQPLAKSSKHVLPTQLLNNKLNRRFLEHILLNEITKEVSSVRTDTVVAIFKRQR